MEAIPITRWLAGRLASLLVVHALGLACLTAQVDPRRVELTKLESSRTVHSSLHKHRVDEIVNQALEDFRVPGAAVAVVVGDEIYVNGYGLRESGKPARVSPNTLFGIGSLTKAFTTTAMAMLVDEGVISWQDHPRKYLPEFKLNDPLADSSVTLRDLVTHRTGLAGHDLLWSGAPWDLRETIRRAGELPLEAPFRTRYIYNNIMYNAAGLAAAEAAGMPWQDLIRQRILRPLDMKGVCFTRSEAMASPDWAAAHRVNGSGRPEPGPWYDDDAQIRPAGSIKASAADLSHWLKFQLDGGVWKGNRLISVEQLWETRKPQFVIPLDPPAGRLGETMFSAYGLGWVVSEYRGHRVVSHGGAVQGFRARIMMVPEAKTGVLVLVNREGTTAQDGIAHSILDSTLDLEPVDWTTVELDSAKRQSELAAEREAKRKASRKEGTKPSRDLAAYAGRYQAPGYGVALAFVESGKLTVHWGSFKMPLNHFHYDTFEINAPAPVGRQDVLFTLNKEGEVDALQLFGQPFRRVRVPDKPLVSKLSRLIQSGTLRIRTSAGTDVMCRTGRQRQFVTDGTVIRFAPVEESVHGVISLAVAPFGNQLVHGLRIYLDNGEVTNITAQSGLPVVKQALAEGGSTGMKFGWIGLNLENGEIVVSLGENRPVGGTVRGSFTKSFTLAEASAHVDFDFIVRDGIPQY